MFVAKFSRRNGSEYFIALTSFEDFVDADTIHRRIGKDHIVFLLFQFRTIILVQLVVSPNRQISPRSPVQRQEPNDPVPDSRQPS